MRTRWVAVLAALCVVLAACGDDDDDSAPDETSAPAEDQPAEDGVDPEGTLRLAYDLVSASRGGFVLDPATNPSNVADLGLYHWIYGGLMRPNPDGTLEPEHAESATVVDNQTIEVVVRDGLTLPDGSTLDAELYKTLIDQNLAMTGIPAFRPGFYSLKTVEVTAPNTLRLGIPDGTAHSWYDLYLSGVETVPVPDNTDFSKPAGAGPYRVTEYTPSQRMALERNPDYWNPDAIRVARVELLHTDPETPSGPNALRAGQVDWTRVEFSQMAALGSDFEVVVTADPSRLYQFYTCKSAEPLDDVRVRQALNMAINREAINEAIFEGTGLPAWDQWPEDHRFHNEETTERYAYDPEAARDLLAEAGFPDGFPVKVIPIQAAGVPDVVQIVQQQWAEIGVNLEIVASTAFVQDFFTDRKAEFGASPITSERGRIDGFTGTNILNTCQYNDPALNQLASQLATVSSSSEEAVQLWHDYEEIIVEEALTIPIMFGAIVYAYDPGVIGDYAVAPYVLTVPDLWTVYVKA